MVLLTGPAAPAEIATSPQRLVALDGARKPEHVLGEV